LSPTSQHATLENIEDQTSVAQNREKIEEAVYQINKQIVTKEEWDTFRTFRIDWRERAGMENQGDNEEDSHREDPLNNEDEVLEYRRWCAHFTIDDTLVTQPQAEASLRAP
jgi:hypothetical protein